MALGFRVMMMAVVMASSLCGETLEIEAKLLKATATPTLRQIAPYPRALCTYLYEVEKVHRGEFDGDRILVVKWAVWNKLPLKGLPAKVGEVERLALDRLINYPSFDRHRIVDEIREVDMVLYYDVGSKPAGVEVARFLKRKKQELETGVVPGEAEGWLFLAEELRHVETGAYWKDWKASSRSGVDPLPAILDFKRRLGKLGVRLLVVPVPTKVSIYAECLAVDAEVTLQSEFLRIMREAGLEVVDLEPVFKEKRFGERPVFCAQDSHWSPEGCRLAANAIRLQLQGDAARAVGNPLRIRPNVRRTIMGDLARMRIARKIPKETITFDRVVYENPENAIVLTQPESEVVLLGDSHVVVFSDPVEEMHGPGGGLADYLQPYLSGPPDVVASYGDGVHQARLNLYQQRSINPKYSDYWKNKKAVIWVFAAREFTRAEKWSTKIPVVRKR